MDENIQYMSLIPNEIVFDLALEASLRDIYNLCQVESRFGDLLCDNENFWRKKFLHDYGFIPIGYGGTWKELYRNYNNIFIYLNPRFTSLTMDKTVTKELFLENFKARDISCGDSHIVFIDLQHNVWSFGDNENGQLGLGDFFRRDTPQQIPNFKAKKVVCGHSHTALIDLDDNVYTFGHNILGQLGLGNTIDVNTPTPVNMPQDTTIQFKAKDVGCGGLHTLLIDLNNNLWAFGSNNDGRLGLAIPHDEENEELYVNVPTLVPNIKATQVSCGFYHSALIDMDNNIFVFGSNGFMQLGLDDGNNGGGNDTYIYDRPTQIENFKALQISCGGYHTSFIDMNNNVWIFGYNSDGQLGLGNQTHVNIPTQIFLNSMTSLKAIQVSCGWYHTSILDMNHNVYGFGNNIYGFIDPILHEMSEHILVPTIIPYLKASLIRSGGYHLAVIGTHIY